LKKEKKKKKKIGEEGKQKSENQESRNKQSWDLKPKCAVQRAPNGRWRSL
jgi:hypothetical protein